MADFLTRLAERTLGVAPVVRALLPPRFAPEAIPYPLDLEREGETPPPADPEEARAPTALEASHRDTPAKRTRGTTDGRREDRGVALPEPAPLPDGVDRSPPPAGPSPDPPADPRPEGAPDTVPPRPAAPVVERDAAGQRIAPPADRRGDPQETRPQAQIKPDAGEQPAQDTTMGRTGEPFVARRGQEDRPPAAPGHPRRTAEVLPGTRPPREVVLRLDEGLRSAPRRDSTRGPLVVASPPEGTTGREASRQAEPLVERVSPSPRAVPEREGTLASEAIPPPPAPDSYRAVSRTVGALVGDVRTRRGPPGPPLGASPHPIRVSIGRVEVRAVTPQPAAPQQQAAQPERLSLEDYLSSRDGERR